MYKDCVIMAPHADDEIIGCYELLIAGRVKCVLFPSEQTCLEAQKTAEKFNFLIDRTSMLSVYKDLILLFPDPYFELHPEHRKWGSIGEQYLRSGRSVLFYSTNMNTPYIREVKSSQNKRQALNECYSEKQDLWKYDHKYFLFEGQTKWIMTWND